MREASKRVLQGRLRRVYKLLERYFGDLKWWPADSDFEVIVGAVLTQNTAWSNVVVAIEGLKRHGLMDPSKIHSERTSRLSKIIKSSGYHRLKSERLKEICRFLLDKCGGDLKKMRKDEKRALRNEILKVKGVGPETADSILLYALHKPVFVVDAYTRRIFYRHGLIREKAAYEEIQTLVHENFPEDTKALNQFHALLVETGKRFCKKKKCLCSECPLGILK